MFTSISVADAYECSDHNEREKLSKYVLCDHVDESKRRIFLCSVIFALSFWLRMFQLFYVGMVVAGGAATI